MKIRTKVFDFSTQDIISDILELGQLCHEEGDIQKVLHLLVEKIAAIMRTDVCSLYMVDSQTKELVLTATKGLNPAVVNAIRLKMGEGLVGKTIEWLKPVSMALAKKSKRFKYFPESGEEQFSSFLSVPLIYNRHPIGVLVIQDRTATRYSQRSVHLLMTLAIPTVSVIEKAKMLETFGQIKSGAVPTPLAALSNKAEKRKDGLVYEGAPASPGIGMGKAKIFARHHKLSHPAPSQVSLHPEVEKMRVLEAFRWVEEELLDVQKRAKKKFGLEELSIFDAYKMVLQSEPFKKEIQDDIDKGKSALESVEGVIRRYTEEMSFSEDDYIRERIYDIQDLGRKITDFLLYGSEAPKISWQVSEDMVMVSDYWSISDFVEMDLEKTRGILSAKGGASSHVAILAQSMGIPAVLGLSSFTDLIHEGDEIILDGSSGVVVLNPSQAVKKTYRQELHQETQTRKKYQKIAHKTAHPKGGKRLVVGANVGMLAHITPALENGAEDIGLYRTEFPFLIRRSLPTEEEQLSLYQRILKSMGGKPVTIRTLDIGGDKYLPYLSIPHEENPCLGWRSIRISLDREDLFRIQLRALLRASLVGPMKLLFPMISSVEEIKRVKEILKDVKKELKSQNLPFAPKIPLGIMMEVPAAVELVDSLAEEVQFFSIGTNDLIQYTLAVDRNNAKVAKLFNPLHPSVLRLIHRTVSSAHKARKQVGVCGEMASQPLCVLLLVGMGVDSLSMNGPMVGKIKAFLNQLNFQDVKKITADVLHCDSGDKIKEMLERFMIKKGLNEFLTLTPSRRL